MQAGKENIIVFKKLEELITKTFSKILDTIESREIGPKVNVRGISQRSPLKIE